MFNIFIKMLILRIYISINNEHRANKSDHKLQQFMQQKYNNITLKIIIL